MLWALMCLWALREERGYDAFRPKRTERRHLQLLALFSAAAQSLWLNYEDSRFHMSITR